MMLRISIVSHTSDGPLQTLEAGLDFASEDEYEGNSEKHNDDHDSL